MLPSIFLSLVPNTGLGTWCMIYKCFLNWTINSKESSVRCNYVKRWYKVFNNWYCMKTDQYRQLPNKLFDRAQYRLLSMLMFCIISNNPVFFNLAIISECKRNLWLRSLNKSSLNSSVCIVTLLFCHCSLFLSQLLFFTFLFQTWMIHFCHEIVGKLSLSFAALGWCVEASGVLFPQKLWFSMSFSAIPFRYFLWDNLKIKPARHMCITLLNLN